MKPYNYEKFLPSKKFTKVIGLCVVGIVLVFAISTLWGSHGIFSRGNQPLVEAKGTINQLVAQDSNNNGIPDWEEALWGLDPKADGATNKDIINKKQAASGVQNTQNATPQNQNEAFSQNLLATVIALQQSGTLTPEAITNLASSIGDSVDAKHVSVTLYTTANMQTVAPGTKAKNTYRNQLKKVLDQYQNLNLGSELNMIANGLDSGSPGSLSGLDDYSRAYISIGKQIIAIPTPTDISDTSLALANTSLQMGTFLQQVEGTYEDAVSGMVGLDDYVKASSASDQATEKMRSYLSS